MHLPPRIQYHIFLICTLLYSTNCSFIFYTLHNPNIAGEFRLDENISDSIGTELLDADKDCRKWWNEICKKYKLQEDSGFKVDYESCVLTLI